MAIPIQGNGGAVAEVDGTVHRALRTVARPTDHGALGHYSIGMFSGLLPAALAGNSEIFQFRWTDATRLALIKSVRISACVSTTFFAAGVPVQIDMVKATGWTVAGSGGTRGTLAALLKKRTSNMASSLVAASDVGISSTAALTAGTKTLETLSLAAIAAPGPITASLNGQIVAPKTELFRGGEQSGEHPLILATNEGFVIRSVAVPATGTWTVAIEVDWAELASY
jgi:hypothetical protein